MSGTLEQLDELGLIEDAAADGDWLSAAEQERYDRQLEYFGELVGGAATRGPPARRGCARRAWS